MSFDFDKLTDRYNTFSMKWDVKDGDLPMWVADMDFETAPGIIEAIQSKAEQGIFGYSYVPDNYFQAVRDWWQERHQFSMATDWIIFATGVVPAISSIIRKMTTVGEKVLVQPPVYNIFYNSIYNNGRHLVENRLQYEDGQYSIDFEDLEQKLADPQTSLMILCNPHNPIGKVWDRATLARIGELCAVYNVLVIADEIHCDLTHPGIDYTPFASVSKNCARISMSCVAPTKTFNLAGLQTASVIVPDPELRYKVNRGLNTDEVAEPNAFAMAATIAAFTDGANWLDALRIYLKGNKDFAAQYIEKHIPQVRVVGSESTYLMWLDCTSLPAHRVKLDENIYKETGLLLSDGVSYGENGRGFLRINLGTQRRRVQDGLQRLAIGISSYLALSDAATAV